ncbi:unnamed protein product [Paramecium sonneborni]|uniref:Protein kinase domain-containing protein n=1 Tax=Paramecium sonneborni TaxID=65129 RepID=A0A8S1QRV0_9CILI|nr:unnamed protein product [Paramecium sonneborni]
MMSQSPSQLYPNLKNILINHENNIVKKIQVNSAIEYNCQKELINLQNDYAKKYPNKVLGIKNISESLKDKLIIVTYDCDQKSIPLSKRIKYSTSRQKFRLFKKLLEILFFLKHNNILHRNLKPNNIIMYNENLYLTDFGYQKNNPYIDIVNFIDKKSDYQHTRNLYPYLSQELVNLINNNVTSGHILQNLKVRDESSVKLQDQYAIGVMMLEIFSPFEGKENLQKIEVCKKLLENRNDQIKKIALDPDFPKEGVVFIKQTISDILENKQLSERELEKQFNQIESLITDYQINKQELMIQDNSIKVDEILNKLIVEFDLNLLYYFSQQQLNNIDKNEQFQQNEKLKKEISRLINLYEYIQNLNKIEQSQIEYFTGLKKEDLFISLVHLDQNIENLIKDNNQEELIKKIEIKQKLMKFYKQINNTDKSEFLFNNIVESKTDEQEQIKVEIKPDIIATQQISEELYQVVVFIDEQNQPDQQNYIVEQTQPVKQNLFVKQPQQNQDPIIELNPQDDNNVLTKICAYKLSSNQQDFQLDLQKKIEENFDDQNLKQFFIIIKLYSSNHSQNKKDLYIYKNKNISELIYIGEIQKGIFCGEIMKIAGNIIFHYINVDKDFNGLNIQGQKSLIYQYQSVSNPEKFKKIKYYIGTIEKGEYRIGEELDYKNNMLSKGSWKNNQFNGQGSKQLFNTENLQQGEPYKWEGNFENNILSGQGIKTHLYFHDQQVKAYSEGQYQNGKRVGKHIYYRLQRNTQDQLQAIIYKKVWFYNVCDNENCIDIGCF